MKKIISLLYLMFFTSSFSQPIINRSNFPSHYSATVYEATNSSFSAGAAGADQIWDFSSVTMNEIHTTRIVPVAGVPYISNFPTANYCYEFNENGLLNYVLYNITANNMNLLAVTSAAQVWSNYITNPELIFNFPFAYNDSFTDTYRLLGNSQVSVTKTYDGYGTLVTPFGSYTNVVRCKIQRQGYPLSYEWFGTNPVRTIAFMQGSSLLIHGNQVLDTVEHVQTLFSIYPNPTQGDFTIRANIFGAQTFVSVYDILGKALITNEKLNDDYKSISLNNFGSGLYIVKITNEQNQILHTQKIIKQ